MLRSSSSSLLVAPSGSIESGVGHLVTSMIASLWQLGPFVGPPRTVIGLCKFLRSPFSFMRAVVWRGLAVGECVRGLAAGDCTAAFARGLAAGERGLVRGLLFALLVVLLHVLAESVESRGLVVEHDEVVEDEEVAACEEVVDGEGVGT
jgi:hypothetical protein